MHATVLKYFAEVAASGSFRRAAERLYVASTAINRQILQLEEELGTSLFDRLPNGVRLNAAGARLLKHVQETQHGFSLLRADLEAMSGEKRGHVTLSAMDSLFLSVLHGAVKSFAKSHPEVTYTFNCSPAYEVMNDVGIGTSDIGVCFVNAEMPSGVRIESAVDLPPGVMMAADHPLAARTELTLDDCKTYPLVRHGAQIMTMQSVLEANFVGSWDAMNTKLSTNFAPLLKELVLDGGYISFFSKVSWIPELHAKRVVWRPLRESGTEKLKLAVVVPAARQLSSATQAFATLLTRLLNDAYEATVAMDDALPSDTSKRKTTSRKSAVALAPPAKHHRVKTAR